VSKAKVEVVEIRFKVGEKDFTATPASPEKTKAAGLTASCNCGDEKCVNGWVWRCMAGGGGQCVWYETHEVC
jgi:hypothetical protein